ATSAAAPSRYDLEVEHLATAHQLSSKPGFADGPTAVVGTGTLTIGIGSTSVDIVIDSAHQTLADIRTAINAQSGDKGVRATIVTGSDGAHLVLSSTKTGAANVIKVTQTGNAGLEKLVYDRAGGQTANYDQLREAENASIRIATFQKTSPNNTITDAIEGVTLNLLDTTEEGDTVSVDIAYDNGGVEDKVRKFVDAYNSLKSTITALSGYNKDTEKAGPLLGDALLRSVDSDIRRGLVDPVTAVTGDYKTLASIGITTNKDGTLTLDSSKLQTALKADFSGVSAIFSSENGIAARLYTKASDRLAGTAELANRNKGLDAQTKELKKESVALETRLATIEARYRKQFTALDGLLLGMQTTSNYLQQQLANLPKIGS
ncbi:MAG: flagellar filament capping protein FliD, partial [Steroidobacteraceae bacterium]